LKKSTRTVKSVKKVKSTKEVLSTKEAIIAVAMNRLKKDGALHLSLRDIAKHAGLSSMAPYRHFKSKEDLVAAISEIGHRRLCEVFLQIERKYLDPKERFRAMGKGYLTFAKENPELYKLMFGASMSNPNDYDGLEKACDECFGYLERAIAYCQHHGIIKGKPVDAFAMLVWSAVHGLSMLLIEGVLEHTMDDFSEKSLMELHDFFSAHFLSS
jgi:AcrR family transcriptional regulator